MSDYNNSAAARLDYGQVLAEIIRQSRQFIGQPVVEDRILGQISAWTRMLASIPIDRLWDCYEHWEETGPRQALRALDLVEAWREIRAGERPREQRAAAVIIDGEITFNCPWCCDEGWQMVLGRGARACSCAAASPAYRNSAPLQPPVWIYSNGWWRPTAEGEVQL